MKIKKFGGNEKARAEKATPKNMISIWTYNQASIVD